MPPTFAITSVTATSSVAGTTLKIGDTLDFTLATAQSISGVTLAGGATPNLTLSNGATAIYTHYDATGLHFAYTVAAEQGSTGLSVTGLVLNGASIDHTTTSGLAAKVDYALGNAPLSIISADVNGDGYADLVTANGNTNTASVLLGNGDGTFQAKQDYTTGSYARSVAAADLNGDGHADLVVANNGTTTLSVLWGNGDGTFQVRQDIALGTTPYAVTAVDVNGDGHADLVTANGDSGKVSVLLSNGDGTFQPKQDYVTGAGPISVTAADVNGDGHADLVTVRTDYNIVSVLLGNGNGTFQPRQDYATGTSPWAATITDVNGDGHADLVTTNFRANTVSVLLGNGDGTFQSKRDYTTGSTPYSLTSTDVDGDGHTDLVTANFGSNTVSVLKGNGDGTFQAKIDYAAGPNPISITTADVNRDGQADVLVADYGASTVSVLQGTQASATHLDPATLSSATGIVTGFSIDASVPMAATIISATTAPTHATSLTYTISFTEAVTGVTASAFTLLDASGHAVTGSVVGTPVSTDGGQTYTVTVSGLTGEDVVHLDLNAIGTGITDLAGNAILGGATGTSVTLDHVAPAITLALSADTGLNNHPLLTDATSGALILNATEFAQALRFGGTVGDANLGTPSGALVTITAADGHTVPPHVVPLQNDRTYAFRVDAPGTVGGVNSSIASALTDGTYTVVAYTQDAAGNIAQTAPTTLIVDTTADVGADAGLSLDGTADHLINSVEARAVGFAISGLDADASAVATFTDGTHTVMANVAANGTGTVDLSGFNGTVTSSLAITDVHQNVASVVGSSVLVDTIAPLAPTNLAGLAIRNGFVNAAANTAAQALTGTAEAGSTVTVYDGATILGAITADATTGRWAYTLGALAEGAHTLSALATDLAGNTGTVSSTLAFTVDTLAPTAPTLALIHDTGVSATDGLTRDGTLALLPSEVGGTLAYTVDGVAVAAYDPASLTQGAHTVAVTQTNAAGNVSGPGSFAFTLDSLAPSIHADAISGRGLTTPLTGNVLANDTDTSPLHIDSLQFGNAPAISVPNSGTAQIAGLHGILTIASNGSYSYQATSAGHDVFTETVMDAAGNASQTTLTLNVVNAQEATFRFFDTKTGGHFFTVSADEAAQVQASLPSFVQEGVAWMAPEKGTDTVDVFRFYDTKTGDHFFTADVSERDGLIQSGSSYHYEGVAFDAFASEGASGTAVVERFFNAQTGQHHYALAEEASGIKQGAAGAGWVDEGKGFVVHVPTADLHA